MKPLGDSPEGLRPLLTNIAVVTVVSLLIWFWAAGQTRETDRINIYVRIVANDPDRLLVIPTETTPVELELQGSRRDLERAFDRLSGQVMELTTGRPSVPSQPGMHTVDVANAFARSDALTSLGVAAINASPSTLPIEVLETVTVTAKVIPMIPGVQLMGDTVVDVPTVSVTVPKAYMGGFGTDPHVEAFLATAEANKFEAGRRQGIPVPLRVPEALAEHSHLIRVVPDTAILAFTLQSRSSTTVLRLVPVQIAGPPADLASFLVEIVPDDQFLRDVEVTGPSETIEALEAGRAKVFAFVHLSADDLAKREARKPIQLWMMPPDVTVLQIGASVDTAPSIGLTIKERTSPKR